MRVASSARLAAPSRDWSASAVASSAVVAYRSTSVPTSVELLVELGRRRRRASPSCVDDRPRRRREALESVGERAQLFRAAARSRSTGRRSPRRTASPGRSRVRTAHRDSARSASSIVLATLSIVGQHVGDRVERVRQRAAEELACCCSSAVDVCSTDDCTVASVAPSVATPDCSVSTIVAVTAIESVTASSASPVRTRLSSTLSSTWRTSCRPTMTPATLTMIAEACRSRSSPCRSCAV